MKMICMPDEVVRIMIREVVRASIINCCFALPMDRTESREQCAYARELPNGGVWSFLWQLLVPL